MKPYGALGLYVLTDKMDLPLRMSSQGRAAIYLESPAYGSIRCEYETLPLLLAGQQQSKKTAILLNQEMHLLMTVKTHVSKWQFWKNVCNTLV
jgi:hypothetical protein